MRETGPHLDVGQSRSRVSKARGNTTNQHRSLILFVNATPHVPLRRMPSGKIESLCVGAEKDELQQHARTHDSLARCVGSASMQNAAGTPEKLSVGCSAGDRRDDVRQLHDCVYATKTSKFYPKGHTSARPTNLLDDQAVMKRGKLPNLEYMVALAAVR